MHSASTNGCCVMFCIICFIFHVLPFCNANLISSKVLNVGKELLKETLPLRKGSCIYQLQGLKSQAWYEVKISYPASIPASFSLQLKRGDSEVGMKQQRRLLNTEKLIFKSDDLDLLNNQGGLFVLVTVESEGVVAIPHAKEREDIIFNIVCDELWLGVPQKAWWVMILVIICLGLAFAVPSFLPAYLLQPNRNPPLHHSEIVFKSS